MAEARQSKMSVAETYASRLADLTFWKSVPATAPASTAPVVSGLQLNNPMLLMGGAAVALLLLMRR